MPGTQVPILPPAEAGVNGVQWYFRFGMGLEKWSRVFGLSDLLPLLSEISHSTCLEVVKEMLGVSRNSLGNQSIVLWGAQAERVECHSEEEPHKCLNLSPFLPLLTSDLRVLVFSSSPPVLWVGRGSSWQSLISKAPGLFTSHSQVVVSFRMQSGTSFGYLFYVFYKALHMRGYR